MSDGRLFPLDDVPEIPLIRPPRRSRGENDARFRNDYPPEWNCCLGCDGRGYVNVIDDTGTRPVVARAQCPDCLGMGSLKARVRYEAGHRCERCKHPYVPKGDAKMLSVEPTPHHWSPCDPGCRHTGPMRVMTIAGWSDFDPTAEACGAAVHAVGEAEAEWRILTVHHLDGDKANCRWWNLAALCQRCHLEIQARVVMERVYVHEHTDWFKPHAAGYYAWVYLDEDVTRADALARMDELLALEYDPALTTQEKT